MTDTTFQSDTVPASLIKCPTGINGLDEITGGGLPQGRPSLICGGTGCGKTLISMEFLVQGVLSFNEPGLFMSFEETIEELGQNVSSLGFHLNDLIAQGKLIVDHVYLERSEIEETGEYDLDGLFIRLNYAIDRIGAKRVVLDTLETLFAGLSNESILRSEIRRLFRWLKTKGVTAIITGERGSGSSLTRQGLEEYISDCVILLEHNITDHIATRHLRIIKYRGTVHGTNEYPFLIGEEGVSVLPITSANLQHQVSTERISSGVVGLDAMLEGKGYYRGSTILVSGTAGTGKSSLAAFFADATCQRGERCLYLAFEESTQQIIRNMRSIDLNLEPWIHQQLLHFHPSRSTMYGLEMHLALIHKLIQDIQPTVVILDPITNFLTSTNSAEVRTMLTRLIDFLKIQKITAFFTSLNTGGSSLEHTEITISSLIDTWLVLRDIELNGERNRGLYIIKSRGMNHSNQIREFLLTHHGIELVDAYLGPAGVLTGSSRVAQEAQERLAELERQQTLVRKQLNLERKRRTLQAQIETLQAELEAESIEVQYLLEQKHQQEGHLAEERNEIARSRRANLA
ncbi:MAG: circadian clock protein KaiC [Chloroflexota bacterium]|nr:circadian clock protein KaiC [Chloroflexota bacterium]